MKTVLLKVAIFAGSGAPAGEWKRPPSLPDKEGAKTVMGFLGIEVGPARLPKTSLATQPRAGLQAGLEQLGFFDWVRS